MQSALNQSVEYLYAAEMILSCKPFAMSSRTHPTNSDTESESETGYP